MNFDDALQNFSYLSLRTRQAAIRNDAVRAGVLLVLAECARMRLIAATPPELLAWAAVSL